jgi:hypothetical protein
MIVDNPEQIHELKYYKFEETWAYRKKIEKLEDGVERSIKLLT